MLPKRLIRAGPIRVGIAIVLAAAGLAAMSSLASASGDSASQREKFYTPHKAEPGTAIPKASVRFGMRPPADNTFYVVGMRSGWFEDVGISIEPKPFGIKTEDAAYIPLLLQGGADVISGACIELLPAYRTTDQGKCVQWNDTFYGTSLLANPELGLEGKTLQDYRDQGLPFLQALKKAIEPVVGKTVHTNPTVAFKPFNELPFQETGLELPKFQNVSDPENLNLAQTGKADFVNIGAAPLVNVLLEAGWTPLYSIGQILANAPAGIDSPWEAFVFNIGLVATADWVNGNKGTMLRLSSAVFRIIDQLEKKPSLYALMTPYLNSRGGTTLKPAEVRSIVEKLDPLVPFQKQTKYYVQKKSPEYFVNSIGALIKNLTASKAIPEGVTPKELVWSEGIWKDLRRFKKMTDNLFKQAEGADLTPAKQRLLRQARKHYGWFNYLDSFRFARAALS